MKGSNNARSHSERWAEFRFSVVGSLLSSPPLRGQLAKALRELSERSFVHPINGEPVRYSFSTIERWYYDCCVELNSPVLALRRKVREDKGQSRCLDAETKELIYKQYQKHPSWSYQLHADNIRTMLEQEGGGSPPCYGTIRRYMQSSGLFKTRRCRNYNRPGAQAALEHFDKKEIRSYEAEYVGGLWHLDFHHGSRQVLTPQGELRTPICLAVMDDRSRLGCHVQWYLREDSRSLVHGFSQAIQKRGLPRALLSDNGSAMMSAEFEAGLLSLGILHETTLPYSPYQNGKQERFFGVLEGRLMAMLEGVRELTLAKLNEATIAWLDVEYNRTLHQELEDTPLNCYLKGKDVTRPSPSSEELRLVFRRQIRRRQRRNDGTVSIEGKRFEVPSRYRQIRELTVRYAAWDLTMVHLVDGDSGTLVSPLYPLDKTKNASGERRTVALPHPSQMTSEPSNVVGSESKSRDGDSSRNDNNDDGVAPLLQKLMAQYAATGLPPAYLPDEDDED